MLKKFDYSKALDSVLRKVGFIEDWGLVSEEKKVYALGLSSWRCQITVVDFKS